MNWLNLKTLVLAFGSSVLLKSLETELTSGLSDELIHLYIYMLYVYELAYVQQTITYQAENDL